MPDSVFATSAHAGLHYANVAAVMRVVDTTFAAAKVKMNIFSDIWNAVVHSAYLTCALPMHVPG